MQLRRAVCLLALAFTLSAHAQYDKAAAALAAGDAVAARATALACAKSGDTRCMRLMGALSRPANPSSSADWSEALRWYRQAAEGGSALGARGLGEFYLYGYGLPKDERAAARWFANAVDEGDNGSLLTLGEMYDLGVGVDRNLSVALALTGLAVQRNVPSATDSLAALRARVGAAEIAHAAQTSATLARTGKVAQLTPPGPTTGPYFFGTVVLARDALDPAFPSGVSLAAIGMHVSSARAAHENGCRSIRILPHGDESAYKACLAADDSRECAGGGWFAIAEASYVIGSARSDPVVDMQERFVGISCGQTTLGAARDAALVACRSAIGAGGERLRNAGLVISPRGTRQYNCSIRAAGMNNGLLNSQLADVAGVAGAKTALDELKHIGCWGTAREHDALFRGDACLP